MKKLTRIACLVAALVLATVGAAGAAGDSPLMPALADGGTQHCNLSGNPDPWHCDNVDGKTCSQVNATTWCYWMNEYGGDYFQYSCTCQYDNLRRDVVWICYCSSCN